MPAKKSKVLLDSKSPSDEPLFTLTSGEPKVAWERISEPSASHWSVAKLYTIECAPVTPEATPLGFVIGPTSKPNPPEAGSELKLLPAKTNVSSTVNVSVFNIFSDCLNYPLLSEVILILWYLLISYFF